MACILFLTRELEVDASVVSLHRFGQFLATLVTFVKEIFSPVRMEC